MKPQLLVVTFALVLAVLAALPLAESKEPAKEASAPTPWPCCDNCGVCTRSRPPQCWCADEWAGWCHPECKECKESGRGKDGEPVYLCMDRITNFCKNKCTPAATSALNI